MAVANGGERSERQLVTDYEAKGHALFGYVQGGDRRGIGMSFVVMSVL